MKSKETKKNYLPKFLKPLFWSYNFSDIDPQEEKKTVIVQIINYGDLDQWKWIINYYGKNTIKKTLKEVPASEIKPRTRRLLSLIFNLKRFNYALRCVAARK